MVYDISNPKANLFTNIKKKLMPEGLLFIPASKSPTKRSLVVKEMEL
jgi:hypothetical protein